jgi:hypothetical protein
MKPSKTAWAQKIPALAVKGYAGIFCQRTTTFIFLINLYQDDLS